MSDSNNINNNLTFPFAKAERLRRLRNMASLTREKLCNIPTVNANTYKGWEIGRFGGLSTAGAKQVIKRVAEEGVICSVNWLLCEEGTGPFVSPAIFSDRKKDMDSATSILQEITIFQNNFSKGIFWEVLDDGISPQYNAGDYIAGIKKCGKDINSLIGQICIIQTTDNEILTRQLLKGETKNTYTLLCPNPKSTAEKPILYRIQIQSAALIIRHYKKN